MQTLSLLGTQGLTFLGSTVLPAVGIGALACLGFAGMFHGGFYLHKLFTQKSKYIELIEDLKEKLSDIFLIIEEDHYKVLKYYSKEIENSVIKFENIMLSNDEGNKKNRKELLKIYNQFKKLVY